MTGDPRLSRWADWTRDQRAGITRAGQWRELRTVDSHGVEGVVPAGPDRPAQSVVVFASNDYLGLSQHPAVTAAAVAAAEQWGAGSGASRLVVGSRSLHAELEDELAAWKGAEAALLFPTGFAANLSVLAAFGAPGTLILSDELNHASIIDGTRLARADVEVYPHGDVEAVERRLAATRADRVMVVSDTVFSMDGDVADATALADVCARHGALLVLDDAHDVFGTAPDLHRDDRLDLLRVGTLSKALGSLGGYVTGRRPCIELLVNRARPFIFTTAPTPADTAAGRAALAVVRSSEGVGLQARLRRHIDRVAGARHPSPIVPIVLGDEDTASTAATSLLEAGLLVPAIRPPTVPQGTSRLRVALSAAHEDHHIDRLLEGLRDLPEARRFVTTDRSSSDPVSSA